MTDPSDPGSSAPTHVGPWRLEHTAAGTGLHRDPATYPSIGSGLADWSPVEGVPPPAAARRVVVIGESTARGWPFADLLSPTSVLQRRLDPVGAYQCVDLSKVGANGEDLIAVARCLPALRPSVIVSFAGNNWMLSPPAGDDKTIDSDAGAGLAAGLASGLRSGGYAGMRAAFVAAAMSDIHEYTQLLAAGAHATGAAVVVVIPEFDLQRFAPPPDVEVPALGPAATRRWYALRAQAGQALAEAAPDRVGALAREMVAIDGGCSPVPGWLAGRAAIAMGDGAAARAALEQSRDSVVGLMVRHTPRVTTAVREALLAAAEQHGFRVVDLSDVLADPELPDLPDPRCFLDHCHLSDRGIEQATAAIADAVLDLPGGSTVPGPGLPPGQRAFADARIAAQLAFQAQPEAVVTERLAGAVAADPGIAGMLRHVRELLIAPAPGWTHPVTAQLSGIEPLRPFLPALVGPGAQRPELWSLLRCLDAVLGPRSAPVTPGVIDVLDLQAPGGHLQANWLPPHDRLVSSCSVTPLHLGPGRPGRGTAARATLEYRTPLAPVGGVVAAACGGWSTALPASPSWQRRTVDLPAEVLASGNAVLEIHWPTPEPDLAAAVRSDADALDRGEFPAVFPVHGEIYEFRVAPGRP